MQIRDLLTLSTQSVLRGGMRSILSMLGIVIGIASVILILSISEAGQRFIIDQVASFGSNLIFVESGSPEELESGGIPTPFPKDVLTKKDIESLKSQDWLPFVTPLIYQTDTAKARGEIASVQVVGTTEDEVPMYDSSLSSGTFFTSDEVKSRRRVVVLGADIAEEIFGFEDPVGKSVEIGSLKYRVMGVMSPGGSRFLQEVDRQVYVPYTAVFDAYGKDYVMALVVKTSIDVDEASERIKSLIRDNHHIDNPKDDDFRLFTQEDTAEQTKQITSALKVFLVAVAMISLVVGGIGIMNIMYVSVTERTKEIGLRKSLGARTSAIMNQFLIEAIFLTFVGGIAGTVFGISLTWLAIEIISKYQDGWVFQLSLMGLILGVVFSTVVGIIFGYAPAKRAATIPPIEALRFE